MKKIVIVGLAAIIVTGGIALGYVLTHRDNLENAVSEYESGDYDDAITMLNRLAVTADYDQGEKVYYYRCKSANKLAEQLSSDFSDELKDASLNNKDAASRNREKQYIEKRLTRINRNLGTDFLLMVDKSESRIVTGGKFYEEFVSRYRGSGLIEDLDYEELERSARIHRDQLLGSLVNFYSRYPNTTYLSELVRLLFDNLARGGLNLEGRDEFLSSLIINFCRRYPTSSEFHRIFTCGGADVNFRNSPGTEGKIVGKIVKDTILIQLEKSMDSVQIGDTRDYWYRVSDLKGRQGWIFGKFLSPLDMTKFAGVQENERWSIDDTFREWSDSNTPQNWIHVKDSDVSTVTFYETKGMRIAKLNSPKGKLSGLYRRTTSGFSFDIVARGRLVNGDSMVLVGYLVNENSFFYVRLRKDEIEVSGRTIPLQTSGWHDYRLLSEDGRFAKIFVDGELLSSRIPSIKDTPPGNRGLYCMLSSRNDSSEGEVEYIKMR